MSKIAIIGSGISGLGAAYALHDKHEITVYETNPYIGGHSRTIDVGAGRGGETIPVDTGFIVFNDWNYPNLLALFSKLSVPYEKSDMSFGVSIDNGWLEYGSSHMFGQPRNWLRPRYWGMLSDIVRFNREAQAYIDRDPSVTLGECLDALKMGEWFRRYYLLAMGAAIWSCPLETVMKFPAGTFLRFFKNHGLLSINNRPQWYTVSGGSRSYVERLTAGFKDRIRLSCGVRSVRVTDTAGIEVLDNQNGTDRYDQVIFACHADEALAMIDAPTDQERDVLGRFGYQDNTIIVHQDRSFMPRHQKAWASWVYLSEGRTDESPVVSLSYWMNNLQNFETPEPVLVTLNPGRRPRADLILDEHTFSHPVFDEGAVRAQGDIASIQGARGLWFCGAYQRYGFHEDGLLSAVNMVRAMGEDVPWAP